MSNARTAGGITRAANNAAKRAALIEEIEFLVRCDVGEAAILSALGYTGRNEALKLRLRRTDRLDLIPRIFEWDAAVEEQQRPNRKAA